MGVVSAKLGIANPLNPTRGTTVELLVDTGALYSVLPRRVLTELGIEPFERKVFKTADGRQIERAVGEAVFAFNSERGISKVVFGDERDASVLGVTALEELGLEVDPASRKLRPSTLFLYSSGHGFSRAEPASPFFLGFSP